jgi:hypothetical protein
VDNATNFAEGIVSQGYDDVALSIVLSSGDSLKFPTPPFNFVWWNATDYPNPAEDPNVEIGRATAIATDTWSIQRAQEGTTASVKNLPGKTYKIIAGPTAKLVSDISTAISGLASRLDVLEGVPVFEWANQTFSLVNPQQEFLLDFEPRAGSVFVYLNGLLERFWSLMGTTVTLEDPALEGDTVTVNYQKEI